MREVFTKAIEEGCIESSPMEDRTGVKGIKYRSDKEEEKTSLPRSR